MVSNLLRISILGSMPSGEEWTINPVWRINGPGQEVTVDKCLAIATAINAIAVPTGFRQPWSTSTFLTGVRVEARDIGGQLMAQAEAVRGTAVAGTGTNGHPFQTSMVISLRTPGPGASGRGRLYLPATGIAMLSSSLRPTSTEVGQILTGTRTFLTAIQSAITAQVTDCILAVWSRKLNTTFGVTSLLAGDILDTQRRRRDSLIETYTQLTYPT